MTHQLFAMRKQCCLLFILLFGYAYMNAQTPQADSLQNLLKAHPQTDSIRVNLLIELAKEFRRPKPKQTDSLADLAFDMATRLNYAKGKGNALAIKAARYNERSDYPSAYKAFNEAKQILVSVNDKKGLIYLLRMEANLYMNDGKHAQSLDNCFQV